MLLAPCFVNQDPSCRLQYSYHLVEILASVLTSLLTLLLVLVAVAESVGVEWHFYAVVHVAQHLASEASLRVVRLMSRCHVDNDFVHPVGIFFGDDCTHNLNVFVLGLILSLFLRHHAVHLRYHVVAQAYLYGGTLRHA